MMYHTPRYEKYGTDVLVVIPLKKGSRLSFRHFSCPDRIQIGANVKLGSGLSHININLENVREQSAGALLVWGKLNGEAQEVEDHFQTDEQSRARPFSYLVTCYRKD